MTDEHISEGVKHIGDAVSAFIAVGALVNMLPSIAALMTIVWTAIRIYETKTFRALISKICGKSKAS